MLVDREMWAGFQAGPRGFLFPRALTLALETIQPHVQKVLTILSASVADYPPSSSVNILKPKTYLMYQPPLTLINSVFYPQRIYVFCVDLRTNSNYFSLQN
jgi:hypothetical protein